MNKKCAVHSNLFSNPDTMLMLALVVHKFLYVLIIVHVQVQVIVIAHEYSICKAQVRSTYWTCYGELTAEYSIWDSNTILSFPSTLHTIRLRYHVVRCNDYHIHKRRRHLDGRVKLQEWRTQPNIHFGVRSIVLRARHLWVGRCVGSWQFTSGNAAQGAAYIYCSPTRVLTCMTHDAWRMTTPTT